MRATLNEADGDVLQAARAHEEYAIEADRELTIEPLRPATHMATVDLLARVIRNSDFSDYEKKGPATRQVFESWVKIFLLVQEEIAHILDAVGQKTGDPLSNDESEAIRYIMGKMIFNGMGSALVSQISSPTIVDTMKTIIEEDDISRGEFILMLYVLEDVDDESWQEMWTSVVSEKKTSGFILECLIDRLWMLAHSKALDDNQAKRLAKVVDGIEDRLGWGKDQKSSVLQGIRDATSLKRVQDA